MKVVLIDDSVTNLVILRSLTVKATKADCVTFSESEAAVAFLIENRVDLIVVDYSMPNITGTELIKRVRASKLNSATPVVMVTGSSEDVIRKRALEVGATAFLNKPVKSDEFQALLKQILD